VLGKVPSSENGMDKGNGDAAEQRARLLGMLGNIQPSSNLHPLLSNRPPWLEEAVETYLEDPDKHFKPFSALVAAEVLGDGARVSEIEEEFAELLRMTSPSEQE